MSKNLIKGKDQLEV